MRILRSLPFLVLLAGPVAGQEHFRDANGTDGIIRGPAGPAIRAELARRNLPCYDAEKGEMTCRMSDRALNAEVHYGTVSGTGLRAALVSILWQYDPTGNAVDARAYVFIDEGSGTFSLVHAGPMVGQEIRDVSFEPGRVRYKAKSLRRNDSRVNPTGTSNLTISYAARGDAASANTAQAADRPPVAPGTQEHGKQAVAFGQRVMLIKNDLRFDANLRAAMSPSLRTTYENAMSPPQQCPVYDGDPRAGGAQGLGNVYAVKADANVEASSARIIAVDMSFRDREIPGTLFRSRFRMELTSTGWLIDDFIDRQGKSFRAVLKERVQECGSPRAKIFMRG